MTQEDKGSLIFIGITFIGLLASALSYSFHLMELGIVSGLLTITWIVGGLVSPFAMTEPEEEKSKKLKVRVSE